MATFVNDTFTQAGGDTALVSHTGETGATWAIVGAGDWTDAIATIYSGTNRMSVTRSSSGVELVYVSGTPGGPNYDVQASVITPATVASDMYIAIVGRGISNTNGYVVFLEPSLNAVVLFSLNAGALTNLNSGSFTFAPNTTYTVVLSMVGTAIVGKINGTTVVSATNGAHTAAGQAGIFIEADVLTAGDGSTSLMIDNFSATDAAGGGGGGVRRKRGFNAMDPMKGIS